MPIPYQFQVKIKYITPLKCKWYMLYTNVFFLNNLNEWIWMNEYDLDFLYGDLSFLMGRCWVVYIARQFCVYIFRKNILFMLSHIWIKYDINVVTHLLLIFRIYFLLNDCHLEQFRGHLIKCTSGIYFFLPNTPS